jgi:hypothetical protein
MHLSIAYLSVIICNVHIFAFAIYEISINQLNILSLIKHHICSNIVLKNNAIQTIFKFRNYDIIKNNVFVKSSANFVIFKIEK